MTTPARHPQSGQYVPDEWAQLRGSLPDHATALMAGVPTVAEQNAANGGAPPVDDGQDDQAKYSLAQAPLFTGAV